MKTLNDYFDKLVCINLDRRFDRWNKSKEQFDFHNLKVERFSAIDGRLQNKNYGLKPGEIGALLSHLKVIKNAKNQGLKNILIIEDDVEFSKDVNKLFFENENQIPEWDFLYLGANHALNNRYMNSSKSPTKVTDNIYRIKEAYAIHCYGVNSTLYDRIISFYDNITKPIDVLYSTIQEEYRSYVFNPPLAWQKTGYSDIMEKDIDYSFLKDGNF